MSKFVMYFCWEACLLHTFSNWKNYISLMGNWHNECIIDEMQCLIISYA
jgi:hypothetical protein